MKKFAQSVCALAALILAPIWVPFWVLGGPIEGMRRLMFDRY